MKDILSNEARFQYKDAQGFHLRGGNKKERRHWSPSPDLPGSKCSQPVCKMRSLLYRMLCTMHLRMPPRCRKSVQRWYARRTTQRQTNVCVSSLLKSESLDSDCERRNALRKQDSTEGHGVAEKSTGSSTGFHTPPVCRQRFLLYLVPLAPVMCEYVSYGMRVYFKAKCSAKCTQDASIHSRLGISALLNS